MIWPMNEHEYDELIGDQIRIVGIKVKKVLIDLLSNTLYFKSNLLLEAKQASTNLVLLSIATHSPTGSTCLL